MDLKLENILNSNVGDELINEFFTIGKGEIFKDYIPISFFSNPVKTRMVISGVESEGEITLSSEDFQKHKNNDGKVLDVYTFNYIPVPNDKIKAGEEFVIKIKGKDMYDPSVKTPALLMDRSYNTLTEKIDTKKSGEEPTETEEGGEEQNVEVGDETFNEIEKDLSDLKSQASKLTSIKLSDRADDPNFRRNLVLNFANSNKTNIKIKGESLFNMLKKLSDDKIVEKDEVKWTDEVSTFFNDLFKLFSQLHKCCKENKLYLKIKKFLKNLYEILKEIRGNYKDQKKRDQVFTKIVMEMGEMIQYLSKVDSFTNKGQKAENIIKEEPQRTRIVFKDFNVNKPEVINDTKKTIFDDENLSQKEMERLAFKLYGKDAGRFFPKLSLKFKDIKNIFGVGVGGIETRQDKLADKYGIYNLDAMVGDKAYKSMKNTPQYEILFENDVRIEDAQNNIKLVIKKDSKKIFNYDSSEDVLVHKTSGNKHPNVSLIYMEMKEEPKEGESYNSKISKIIPTKGPILEKTPNYRVKFKVIDKL
jgi:hypothetical protein